MDGEEISFAAPISHAPLSLAWIQPMIKAVVFPLDWGHLTMFNNDGTTIITVRIIMYTM